MKSALLQDTDRESMQRYGIDPVRMSHVFHVSFGQSGDGSLIDGEVPSTNQRTVPLIDLKAWRGAGQSWNRPLIDGWLRCTYNIFCKAEKVGNSIIQAIR